MPSARRSLRKHGLKPVIAQANIAFNNLKGTLRGMHFQYPPAAETKVVRCTRGAILDIIVDLRPESPTYLQHVAVELTADNHRALYVPERFAHSYQTLQDETETSYQVGEFYAPGSEGGLLYSDPPPWASLAAPGYRDIGKGPSVEAARRAGDGFESAHEPLGGRIRKEDAI